jgi:O-antigen/teichoic acid export membrane protein
MLANYVGQAWMALIGLAFVPLYLKFLGIEAYGLIGLFTTLLAILSLLDLGLGSTINREMARLRGRGDAQQEMRDLLRTFELPYWAIAVIVGGAICAVSGWLARDWVSVKSLTTEEVRQAVLLMGLSVAARWPAALYIGALMGLERQVAVNGLAMAVETVRGFGAIAVLWLVAPTLEAFFLWQTFVSLVHTVLLHMLVRSLLGQNRYTFRSGLLKSRWRFAAGITLTTVFSTILMQVDKLVLSRLLTLEAFGYYSLANVVALTLYRFFGPVFSAVYPRLTHLMEKGASRELAALYHSSAQVLSVAVLPAAAMIVIFSHDLMLAWTHDARIAAETHALVSVLALGTALNGLMHIPYALQLAAGWTRLALLLNAAAVLLLVPLLFLLTRQYGALGGASVWLILNTAYVLVDIQIMHRRLLRGEKGRWYVVDVGIPAIASFGCAAILKLLQPDRAGLSAMIVYLISAGVCTLTAAALATPFSRTLILHRLSFRAG